METNCVHSTRLKRWKCFRFEPYLKVGILLAYDGPLRDGIDLAKVGSESQKRAQTFALIGNSDGVWQLVSLRCSAQHTV